ncbi:MAG: hypothetical protein JWR52_2528 [Marmoricola sp.]|nr:hypothetical protein [Marmoricola sp.]
MPKTSKSSATQVVDYGSAEDRTEFMDDYTCSFTTIKEDSDLAPILKNLPSGDCQCPHWGYLFSGTMTVNYEDRVEVIEPGDAFYMSPGHAPAAVAGTEFVMFSPSEGLRITEQAIATAMQAMHAPSGG